MGKNVVHLPMMVMVITASIRMCPVKIATAHMHTTRDRTTLYTALFTATTSIRTCTQTPGFNILHTAPTFHSQLQHSTHSFNIPYTAPTFHTQLQHSIHSSNITHTGTMESARSHFLFSTFQTQLQHSTHSFNIPYTASTFHTQLQHSTHRHHEISTQPFLSSSLTFHTQLQIPHSAIIYPTTGAHLFPELRGLVDGL